MPASYEQRPLHLQYDYLRQQAALRRHAMTERLACWGVVVGVPVFLGLLLHFTW